MPLKHGKSAGTRESNIEAEIAAGKPPKQAVAIGYSVQRAALKGYADGGVVDETDAPRWRNMGDVWVDQNGNVSETDPGAAAGGSAPGLASTEAAPVAPAAPSSPPPKYRPPPPPADPELHAVRMTESADGLLKNSPPDADGTRAGGLYQSKADTFARVVRAHPELHAKYGKIAEFAETDPEGIAKALDADDQMATDVAGAHWSDLRKQIADPVDAYARYNASPHGAKLYERLKAGEILHGTDLETAIRIKKNAERFASNLEVARRSLHGATASAGDATDSPADLNVRPGAPGAALDIANDPVGFQMEFRPMVDKPGSAPSFTRAAPQAAAAPPGTHLDDKGVLIDDTSMLPSDQKMTQPDNAGAGGAVPGGTLEAEASRAATGPGGPTKPMNPTDLAIPAGGPAGAGGPGAGATAAPAPDSLQKQYDTVLSELSLQRKNDQAWGAAQEQALSAMRGEALSGKIDPDHMFASRGTASRIMAAIAMGLGGFGGALTHSPNGAMEITQAAIASDIESQKEQLGRKVTVYSQALQQFGNERLARQAATQILWDQARALGLEMKAQAGAGGKLGAKAAMEAGQAGQATNIIKAVADSWRKNVGFGSSIAAHVPDNPAWEPTTKRYLDDVKTNAEFLMKSIPGIRHTPENVTRIRNLFPDPGLTEDRNQNRLNSLTKAVNTGALTSLLTGAGVEFGGGEKPGAVSGSSEDLDGEPAGMSEE